MKFTRRLSLSRLYSHGHSIRQLVRMGLNAIMIPGLVMPKVVPILMLVVLAAINMQ